MPRHVAVGEHPSEVLDPDRGPRNTGPPVCRKPRPGVMPEPGPTRPKQADADNGPEAHRGYGTPRRKAEYGPSTQERQQEPSVDLGEKCERPDCARGNQGAAPMLGAQSPFTGQQGRGPE